MAYYSLGTHRIRRLKQSATSNEAIKPPGRFYVSVIWLRVRLIGTASESIHFRFDSAAFRINAESVFPLVRSLP